jgi:hypothetical protein
MVFHVMNSLPGDVALQFENLAKPWLNLGEQLILFS